MTQQVLYALVTGASKGIGQKTALQLARDGFHVIAHYNRSRDGAESTLAEIHALGGKGSLLCFDQTDSAQVMRELDGFFESHKDGILAACINNAGANQDTLLGLMSDKAFDDVLKVNLYGCFYVMRWAARKMISQRSGCIVNLSSLAGQVGNPGQANYAASKAGIIALTKTLAMELGGRNVRVNCVSPGLIETEMTEGLKSLGLLIERIPLKRMGRAEEVANVVSFLCSPAASYVTGQTLSVNGGLYCA